LKSLDDGMSSFYVFFLFFAFFFFFFFFFFSQSQDLFCSRHRRRMRVLVIGDSTPLAKVLIAALIASEEFGGVTLFSKTRNRMWSEVAGASEKLSLKVVEMNALATHSQAFTDVDAVFCCLDGVSEGADDAVVTAAQLCRGGNVEHFCPIIGSGVGDREPSSKALEALHQRLLSFLIPHVSLWHVAARRKPLLLSLSREASVDPTILSLALLECILAYRDRLNVESAPSAIYDQTCALAFSKLYEERLLRQKDPTIALSPRGSVGGSASPSSARSPVISPRSSATSASSTGGGGSGGVGGGSGGSASAAAAAAAAASVSANGAPLSVSSATAAGVTANGNGTTTAALNNAVSPRRRRHHRR
jgi:hypothetical protein